MYPFNFGIRLRKTPITAVNNPKLNSHSFNIKNNDKGAKIRNLNQIEHEESGLIDDYIDDASAINQRIKKIRDPQVNTHCYFHCLANDKCRKNLKSCGLIEYDCRDYLPTSPHNHLKGTIAGVPIIPYKPTFSEVIQEHLEQQHWNILVQFEFMDDAIYAERMANMVRILVMCVLCMVHVC